MDDLVTGTTLLTVAIGLAAILAMLYALAALIRDQTSLHDLKRRVRRLRAEYTEQVAEVELEDDEEITRLAREKFGGPLSKAA